MESSVRIIWSSWAFCKRNKNSKQKGMSNMNFYCALFWTSPLASLTLSLVMWGESFKWENISTWKVIVMKRDLFVLLKTLFSVCFSISIVFSARVPVRVSNTSPNRASAFYYTFNQHMVAAIIVRIKTQFTSWVLIHWWDIATLFSTILLVNCMEIIFFTLQTIWGHTASLFVQGA